MAFVVLSFKYSKCPLKRCPWFVNITPRYFYLIHSSMTTTLNVKGWVAGITWNILLKTIILVFVKFNIRYHLWQYFASLFNKRCRPLLVSDKRMRSSAWSKWFIFIPPIFIPGSFAKKFCMSSIYALNSVGLIVPPWSTPYMLSKSSPTSEFHLTRLFDLWNISRKIVNILPVKPRVISLKSRGCLFI